MWADILRYINGALDSCEKGRGRSKDSVHLNDWDWSPKHKVDSLCISHLIAQFTSQLSVVIMHSQIFYCMRIPFPLLIATVIALETLSTDCMQLYAFNGTYLKLKVQYSSTQISFFFQTAFAPAMAYSLHLHSCWALEAWSKVCRNLAMHRATFRVNDSLWIQLLVFTDIEKPECNLELSKSILARSITITVSLIAW